MTTPITGTGPGVYVPQPQVGAQRYGLFSAANGPMDLPEHAAVSGVVYEALHCGNGFIWPGASCNPPGTSKTFNGCNPFPYGTPFTVGGTYHTSAIGRPEDEMRRNAVLRLTDNQQQLVEQMLWGGNASPAMADLFTSSGIVMQDVTPTPGTAVSPTQGVGLLEDYISQYPYRGILHARPSVASYATKRLLSIPDGKPGAAGTKYVSPMGNLWSYGRGYSGNKPTDASVPVAGTAYIAVTGPVTLWRDPEIYVNPPLRSMNRSTNEVYVLAEQAWAGTVECMIGFVLISLATE